MLFRRADNLDVQSLDFGHLLNRDLPCLELLRERDALSVKRASGFPLWPSD